MPVKIRLTRQGRKKQPFYHIIVADSRSPRDGKFIERIGSYNPMTVPATIDIDVDKAYDWLTKGAQPTNTARAILRFKGVLFKKHLQRGVAKGALTQEQADAKLAEWIAAKDAKIQKRIEKTAQEKLDWMKYLSGEVKAKAKVQDTTEAAEAFRVDSDDAADAADAVEEVTEAPVAETAEEAPETPAESTDNSEAEDKPEA